MLTVPHLWQLWNINTNWLFDSSTLNCRRCQNISTSALMFVLYGWDTSRGTTPHHIILQNSWLPWWVWVVLWFSLAEIRFINFCRPTNLPTIIRCKQYHRYDSRWLAVPNLRKSPHFLHLNFLHWYQSIQRPPIRWTFSSSWYKSYWQLNSIKLCTN